MSSLLSGSRMVGAVCRAMVGAAALIAGVAWADEVKVSLTGMEETPSVTTAATGAGAIMVNADKTVSGSVVTKGMVGTMAHIHLGAPGKAGPPIITLGKEVDDTWVVPPGSKLSDEQYASYKAGDLYVNVHTAEHKGGEVRAQLKPQSGGYSSSGY